MVTHKYKKTQFFLLLSMFLLLVGCGAKPKPISQKELLINALMIKDNRAITQHKTIIEDKRRVLNLVQLYQLMVANEPYRVIANSQILLGNIHHYSLPQQAILKQILLWAYAHPIYRQETGKQIRILQRTELLVAPSEVDFLKCERDLSTCSDLRRQIEHIISTKELNEALYLMADHDPCINLGDEGLTGDFANQCLASRKGDLKINLLSMPSFLVEQWEVALE